MSDERDCTNPGQPLQEVFGEMGDEKKRVIDGKFHVEIRDNAPVIVKTSSGEIVPEWEPLILQRSRDHLMLPTLRYYRRLSELDGCNDFHMQGIDSVIANFQRFADEYPEWMKQPGVTRGAAFVPEAHPETPAQKARREAHEALDQYLDLPAENRYQGGLWNEFCAKVGAARPPSTADRAVGRELERRAHRLHAFFIEGCSLCTAARQPSTEGK